MPLLKAVTTIELSAGGISLGSWAKAEGLDVVFETVDYKGSSAIRTPIVQTAQNTILLSRTQSGDTRIRLWYQSAIQNSYTGRKNCVLRMHSSNTPVARYHLENAWPSKIEIGSLTSGGSRQLLETVTLVCEDIQRVSP
jgi:phage tail-like protein